MSTIRKYSAWIGAAILVSVGLLWFAWPHRPPSPAALSSTISAASFHMLAINADGHIFGWGNGELALEGACYSYVPRMMSALQPWRSVHAGTRTSYAIAKDGTLWRREPPRAMCNSSRRLPSDYESLHWNSRWLKAQEALGIAAGLDEQGSLWFWNDSEILPEAARDLGGRAQATLTKATGARRWQDFCLGANTVYAVADDGTLWTGALALKPFDRTSRAADFARMVPISAPVRLTRVFCREHSRHVLALDLQGALWGLGDNTIGALGTASGGPYSKNAATRQTAIQRVSTRRWRSAAVGNGFTLAIAEDGSLWSWGNNARSALGTGDRDNSSSPRRVEGPGRHQQWAAVAAGPEFAMGLTETGTIYTWGTNLRGSLGDGTDTHVHVTPTQIYGKQRWALPLESHPAPLHDRGASPPSATTTAR